MQESYKIPLRIMRLKRKLTEADLTANNTRNGRNASTQKIYSLTILTHTHTHNAYQESNSSERVTYYYYSWSLMFVCHMFKVFQSCEMNEEWGNEVNLPEAWFIIRTRSPL